MQSHRVLVTCPPMLGMLGAFVDSARELGLDLVAAEVTQTLSEAELMDLLPDFDNISFKLFSSSLRFLHFDPEVDFQRSYV